jgi:putative MATE family efflux protein
MAHQEYLRELPIKSLLWKQSIPAMIALGVNALYNIIDGIFVGLATGEKGIAAISVVFPIQAIFFALGLLFSVGASSIYSRAIGANDEKKAKLVVNSTIMLLAIISALLIVVGLLFAEPIGYLFGMQDAFKVETMNYLTVIFYGTPFLFFNVFFNNMFRADGQAKVAMVALVIGTMTNIILDPIFIFGYGLGTLGAAIATVIGYSMTSLFIVTRLLKERGSFLVPSYRYLEFNPAMTKEVMAVGFPIFIRNTIASFVAIVINNSLRIYAVDPVLAVAIYGIVSRVQLFLLLPLFGINQGMMPIIGFNFGANLFNRVHETRRYAFRAMTGYLIIAFSFMFLMAPLAMRMFGVTDPVNIEYGQRVLRVVFLLLPLFAAQVNLSGYYQAIGKPKIATFLALLRQFITLIPLILILPIFFGEWGVWISIPIADTLTAIISIYLYRQEDTRSARMLEALPA